MFAHEFMRNAVLAGAPIALACGLVGYFLVLRAQVFAGDALSHVAFTGALAAAAAGVDTRIGLFVATVAVGAGIGALGGRGRVADDVAIGTVFAWVLGLGLFFLALFARNSGGGTGIQAARTLFGSIFGLGASEVGVAAAVAAGVVVCLLAIARPLLFASLDPLTARADGVPTLALGIAFAALLGVVAGEATQAVGALLLLGLIAGPAAAARRLTSRPWAGLLLSAGLSLLCMVSGLIAAYEIPSLPPSSAVIFIAAALYIAAALVSLRRRSAGSGRAFAERESRQPT
jgi:zinc/manganese transport system permease protein